jgi:hypothetical protein
MEHPQKAGCSFPQFVVRVNEKLFLVMAELCLVGMPRKMGPMKSQSFYRNQLRLAIGDEAFNAIPDREPAKRVRPPVQRRPRIEARQRIVLCGLVPAIVAAGFTVGECAVLCVIAREHKRRGRCDLTIGEISYSAQCGRTLVQNALRQAVRYGLISIDHRRVAYDRNLPNVVTIISRAWLAWLRLGPARPRPWGGGGWQSPRERVQKSERKPIHPSDVQPARGCPNNRAGHSEPYK